MLADTLSADALSAEILAGELLGLSGTAAGAVVEVLRETSSSGESMESGLGESMESGLGESGLGESMDAELGESGLGESGLFDTSGVGATRSSCWTSTRGPASSVEALLAGDGDAADAGEASDTTLGAVDDSGAVVDASSPIASPLRSLADNSIGAGGSPAPVRIELMPKAPAARAAVAVPAVTPCQRERCLMIILQGRADFLRSIIIEDGAERPMGTG